MATKKTAKKKVAPAETVAHSADVFSVLGKKQGTVELPQGVFGVAWNAALIHQVITSMDANARTPIAHVKTRGEVRGGGKKPWKQKGTGRARHGSSRSPIWVGGGVTHGPRNDKIYAKKINKKMRTKALAVALSKKVADNEILFVDRLSLETPKTKDAKALLVRLSGIAGYAGVNRRKNAALFVAPTLTPALVKSFRNMGNVLIKDVASMNPVDTLTYKHIVIVSPEESIAVLESRILGTK